VIFPSSFSMLLTIAGAIGLGIFTLWLWFAIKDFRDHVRFGKKSDAVEAASSTVVAIDGQQRAIQAVVLAACVSQFVVSILWFFSNYIFDRYLLLFVPGLLIFLGIQAGKEKARPILSWIAWSVTAVVAIIGFCFAQEYAAYGHARADLFYALRSRGIPLRAINAGFELDGDAQICTMGYVNSPQVVKPVGAFKPNLKAPHVSFLPEEFVVLDPYYRISSDSVILPDEDAYATPVMTTTYHSLLPPFERKMYVYKIKR